MSAAGQPEPQLPAFDGLKDGRNAPFQAAQKPCPAWPLIAFRWSVVRSEPFGVV